MDEEEEGEGEKESRGDWARLSASSRDWSPPPPMGDEKRRAEEEESIAPLSPPLSLRVDKEE